MTDTTINRLGTEIRGNKCRCDDQLGHCHALLCVSNIERRCAPAAHASAPHRRNAAINRGLFGRQDAFGVELHALDAELPVTNAHDLTFRRPGRDFQSPGRRSRSAISETGNGHRLLSNGFGRPSNSPAARRARRPKVLPCMSRSARTMVPPNTSTSAGCPRQTPNSLISPANPLDHLLGDAGVRWHSRSRRNTKVRRRERDSFIDGDAVITVHENVGAKHQEGLHEGRAEVKES